MIPTPDVVNLIYELRDPADDRHVAARVMLTALLLERERHLETCPVPAPPRVTGDFTEREGDSLSHNLADRTKG